MQQAQATLQSFVEQVPVGIHINRLGPGGIADQTVEFLNDSICKPYGLHMDKVIGRDPYAVFRNDLVVRLQKDMDRKILKTRKPAVMEMLNPYSKWHERYTRFPILSPDGTITHIGGTHVDVDDTVRAKAQLDEVRMLVDSVFDNIPTVLYLRDLDGTIRMINKYGAAMFGKTHPAEVIGQNATDLDSEAERREAAAAQAQLLATGQPVTQEYRRHVGGRDMTVLNTIFPIRDATGQIVRIGGFASDVTELYKARNELQDAQNLLQTIFDNVPAELYLRRLDGQYLMANHWALDFYGMTEADLPHLTAETFDTGDGTAVSRQAQRELLATGRPVTREYHHQARGRDVVILNTIFPLRNADGQIDRIGGVSTDITELLHARTQLRQAQESLHQSEKLAALGQLLAGIAHELNNPLAVVLGRAAILQEKLTGTPHATPLQKLREAANRCARIVKTFLAMARQTGPRRQLVDVNDLIESALELTTYGLRTCDITWNARALSQRLQIEADPDQIVQVLINLIINAQHALQDQPSPRSLDIRTYLNPDGDWLTIAIADNGPGVPDAIAHRIFDPFFTTKAVGQGTGLGLSVCKSMIEAHGGRLTLDRTPGGGATFRLSLPTAHGAALDSPQGTPAATPRTRGRILIVDDEVEIAAILADCLSPLGLDCAIATDGNDALRRIAEHPFDAVFCDVSMPGMDGITFYHILKQTNPLLAAHLVFISGDVLHRNWEGFKSTVDRPILEKPFDPEQIRHAALTLLAPTGGQ
jgi:PAS domain S-box-containing protein